MTKPDYDKQVPNKRIQFVGDIDVNRFCQIFSEYWRGLLIYETFSIVRHE